MNFVTPMAVRGVGREIHLMIPNNSSQEQPDPGGQQCNSTDENQYVPKPFHD
jgi:hypothetical protein